MPLKHDVCENCIRTWARFPSQSDDASMFIDLFESDWKKKGRVYCPPMRSRTVAATYKNNRMFKSIDTNGCVPEWCLYCLEQVVS